MRKPTLLATSRAVILKEDGGHHAVRLLIDQGSELSFISEEVVRLLKLHRNAASIPLVGIGGTYSGRTRGTVSIQLQSIYDSEAICTIHAFILQRLTTKLPPFDANCRPWPHISELQLADPDFFRSGPIHLILGSDNYGSIIMPGLIKGDPSSPTAQQTIFGWILSGPISDDEIESTAYGHHCAIDYNLQESIERFWTQEEVPNSSSTKLTTDEEECEQHFLSTHSRDATGRYVVRLPLKATPTALGDSKSVALGCLRRLSHRLSSDLPYKQQYVDFIEEYKSLGHMVPVAASEDTTSPTYYLPHHGVL